MLSTKIFLSQALKIIHETTVHASLAQADISFDFKTLAFIMAGISFGLIGVVMAGAGFFPDIVEPYKRHIPTVIQGLILIGVSSAIMGAVGG